MKSLTIFSILFYGMSGWAQSVSFTEALVQGLNPPEGTEAVIYQKNVASYPKFIAIQSNEKGEQIYQFCSKPLSGEPSCQDFGDKRCTITSEKMAATIESRKQEAVTKDRHTGTAAGVGVAFVGSVLFQLYRCMKGKKCPDVIARSVFAGVAGGVAGYAIFDRDNQKRIQEIERGLRAHGSDAQNLTNAEIPRKNKVLAFEVENIITLGHFLGGVIRQTCEQEIASGNYEHDQETGTTAVYH